jgi:hypothetical protein
MPHVASDDDSAHAESVTLGPADCRDVNRWWTIARSITNAMHELRNALQVISGNVEMMQLSADLDDAATRRLGAIAAQAARAVNTIEPLAGYAREASSAPVHVDLHHLAALALSFRAVSLGRGRVETSMVPAAGDPLFVRVSTSAALQLLVNLVLRAESEVYGRPAASITVAVQPGDGEVIVVIEGRAQGQRPDTVRESVTAEKVSAYATAELTRICGALLRVEHDQLRIRLTLSMPSGAGGPQATDPASLSR